MAALVHKSTYHMDRQLQHVLASSAPSPAHFVPPGPQATPGSTTPGATRDLTAPWSKIGIPHALPVCPAYPGTLLAATSILRS